ncbi:MAG: MBL fold metallo-hydrolase [Rhizobiaceae bacterium]
MTALTKPTAAWLRDLDPPLAMPEDFGRPVEVVEGIFWARLALPMRLNHVNVWLLADDDGWTVIDCGLQSPDFVAFWEGIARDWLGGKPVKRLFATHGHLDHIGLSGWFVDRFGADFAVTKTEFEAARRRSAFDDDDEVVAFFRRHGMAGDVARETLATRNDLKELFGAMPRTASIVADGDRLVIGARTWLVRTFGGHAAEHAMAYCAEAGVLIAGDQILPQITPAIAVFPDQQGGDPLKDYLESLDWLETLPGDTLVLPSHGLPFRGLRDRVAYMRAHHMARLDEFESHMGREKTAYELAGLVFAHAMSGGHAWIAVGETLAHLHYLVTAGRARRSVDPSGVERYAVVP